MEEILRELIVVIQESNAFSWKDFISVMSVVASWITIGFLLKERAESNRPYLQITFELVRSNLTCVVLRNTGTVPLTINKLHFEEEFINQLPERERERVKKNKVSNMTIFPGKQWIICLGVIIPEILEKYDRKTLNIDYTYTKLKKKKKYEENVEIDFEQYGRCLVYISDIDELRNVNKQIANEIEQVKKDVHEIHGVIVKYANISDACNRTIVAGYEQDTE